MELPASYSIVSSSGEILEISAKALEMSDMAQAAARTGNHDRADAPPIELFVSTEVAKLVVDYCERFKDVEWEDRRENYLASRREEEFFAELDAKTLIALGHAADFLQILRLRTSLCRFVSNRGAQLVQDGEGSAAKRRRTDF